MNVGAVREVRWRETIVHTGIWKQPAAGRIRLRGVNLAGDDQADRTVHGGPDKAVYAYAEEDYTFWRTTEGIATEAGLFGENLTIAGLDVSSAVVGERWRLGSVVLEVAQPRLPCFKLGVRMSDATFPKRFQAALRPGAYLRVIAEGDVGAGDVVEVVERPAHGVTVADLVRALGDPQIAVTLRGVSYLPEFWRRVIDR